MDETPVKLEVTRIEIENNYLYLTPLPADKGFPLTLQVNTEFLEELEVGDKVEIRIHKL